MDRRSLGLLCLLTLVCCVLDVSGQYCPSKTTTGNCPSGKHTCTCPGNKQKVHFKIDCSKRGWWSCGNPRYISSCGRYSLCNTCRDGVGYKTEDVCTSCLNKGYTGGKCRTDVNECASENGGCGQNCVNTQGSYHCLCNSGYSLAVNKHACDRKSCGRPGDKDGLKMVSLPFPGANDFEYESSVEYSCSRLHHVIVGHPEQRCDLGVTDSNIVEWHGGLPDCVVECNPTEEHARCGVTGVDPLVCDQLGCCFNEERDTCHMRPGHIYLEYNGVRPMPDSGYKTPNITNANECKIMCEADESCESFSVVQDHAKIMCYLYQYGRREYIYDGLMRNDEASTYYDPMFFEDDIDWREEKSTLHHHFEYGCQDNITVEEYLPLIALTEQRLMTSMECAQRCRSLGYQYSGVRLDECRCGKEIPSEDFSEDDIAKEDNMNGTLLNHICTFNCSGDAGQFCGGENVYTIQYVADDARYLGCYDDNIHHMPIRRWGKEALKSVEECIQECARLNFAYAGVQDGGACVCGPQFPMDAGVSLTTCDTPCVADSPLRWCGSEKYNSVYRTHAAFDLTNIKVAHHAVNLYHDEPTITTIDTALFTVFPQLKNFVTNKFAITASMAFMAPEQDHFCSSGECYAPCGSLNLHTQVITDQENVIIRQFVLRSSELLELLDGKNPKQVNVYAQVFYIDASMSLDFTLLVRARQVFINRETAMFLHSSNNASTIYDNKEEFERIKYNGLYPDLFFQRIAYTCVRILTSTKDQKFINIGYDIVHDLIGSPAEDVEQEAMVRSARTLAAQMAGIDFTSTHHVPLYNKDHLVSILETYYDQISIYKEDYDRIQDSALLYADFLSIAGSMNSIHKSTVVNEALVSLKNIEETYAGVTKLQEEMEKNYLEARKKLEAAMDDIKEDIKKLHDNPRRRAQWSYYVGLGQMAEGITKGSYGTIAQTVGTIFGSVKKLETTYNQLAAMVAQMEIIMFESKTILSGDNNIITEREGPLVVDLEKMVSMSINIVQWKVMKDYSNLIIADLYLPSATQFEATMSAYCNWGQAFSEAMVDRAETLRQLLDKRAIYDLRKLQEERSEKVIRDAGSSVTMRHEVMHVMQEQMLDIALDLNNLLVQFCQAYFFENLKECREEYRPSFGGSMSSLLLKINAAKRDSLFSADIPASVSRSAIVVDRNTTGDCSDPLVCPINCFNKERFLVMTVSPNDDRFYDIQKYRVKEVFLEFHNLDLNQETDMMKFYLTNTGLFRDKKGAIYNFLTRPVHLAFEREVVKNGHVSIHADFPDDIHQITPFTTWVIKISDETGHLDLSDVDRIDFRFDGSGII